MNKDNKQIGLKMFTDLIRQRTGIALSERKNLDVKTKIEESNVGIVFACVDKIAETIATTDWRLLKDGKPVEDKEDKVLKLLLQPNPIMSWFEFIYICVSMELFFGEVYIYIVRDTTFGMPMYLIPIPSFFCNPIFDKDGITIKGYRVQVSEQSKSMLLKREQVIYYYKPDVYTPNRGESRVDKCLLELDIHKFAKRYALKFFSRGAIPSGVLETDKILSDKDVSMLERKWSSKFEGIDKNLIKIAVLWGGLKYKNISLDRIDEGFIEQSKWTRDDILAVFGVYPSVLGYSDNVNKSTAESQRLLFFSQTIQPKLKRLSSVINYKLFTTHQKMFNGYKFEFEKVDEEQLSLKIKLIATAALYGAITINEIRSFLKLDKVEGGDELVTPLNYSPNSDTQNPDKSYNQQDLELIKALTNVLEK